MVSFAVKKPVGLIRSHLFIFGFFTPFALGDWPKRTLVWFMSENALPVIFSRSFMVSWLMFMTLSHFEFNFVQSGNSFQEVDWVVVSPCGAHIMGFLSLRESHLSLTFTVHGLQKFKRIRCPFLFVSGERGNCSCYSIAFRSKVRKHFCFEIGTNIFYMVFTFPLLLPFIFALHWRNS